MEYSLIKINELRSYADVGILKDTDLVLVEIDDGNGKWITAKAQVQQLFNTRSIRLTNASLFSAQLGEFAVELGLGDSMTNQEDFNKFVGVLLSRMFQKLNEKPDIILHAGPTQPNPIEKIQRKEFVEGTLWIDTTNYRVYVAKYFLDSTGGRQPIQTWIGLTDR